jgi:hypothetical protein
VTMTTVVLHSRWNCFKSCMISAPVTLSSAPVGSSAISRSGRVTSARAIATRCC